MRVRGRRDALALPVGEGPAFERCEPKVPFGASDDVIRWSEFTWAPLPNELLRAWQSNDWVLCSAEAGTRLDGRPIAEFVSPL